MPYFFTASLHSLGSAGNINSGLLMHLLILVYTGQAKIPCAPVVNRIEVTVEVVNRKCGVGWCWDCVTEVRYAIQSVLCVGLLPLTAQYSTLVAHVNRDFSLTPYLVLQVSIYVRATVRIPFMLAVLFVSLTSSCEVFTAHVYCEQLHVGHTLS